MDLNVTSLREQLLKREEDLSQLRDAYIRIQEGYEAKIDRLVSQIDECTRRYKGVQRKRRVANEVGRVTREGLSFLSYGGSWFLDGWAGHRSEVAAH